MVHIQMVYFSFHILWKTWKIGRQNIEWNLQKKQITNNNKKELDYILVITRLYSPLFLEKLFRKGLEMFSVCRYLMRKLLMYYYTDSLEQVWAKYTLQMPWNLYYWHCLKKKRALERFYIRPTLAEML